MKFSPYNAEKYARGQHQMLCYVLIIFSTFPGILNIFVVIFLVHAFLIRSQVLKVEDLRKRSSILKIHFLITLSVNN